MNKHIEIRIQHIRTGKFLSQKDFEEWELRLKALEIALRINPDLLKDFEDDDGLYVMY